METMGSKFKELRLKRFWSQKVVAEKLNISVPAYSKLECNITDVNLSRLKEIAAIFEVSLVELVNGDQPSATILYERQQAAFESELRKRDDQILKMQNKLIFLLEEVRSLEGRQVLS